MNALGSLWIFALMLMIDADAFGRTFLAHPIHGVNELVEMSLIGIVFMQLADALRVGVLTRSDGLFNQAMARKPAIGHFMGMVTGLLGAFFMTLIQIGSVPYLIDAWNKDYYVGIEGLFTAPQWPIALIIVIAIVVTMIQFLINFATHLRSLVQRG